MGTGFCTRFNKTGIRPTAFMKLWVAIKTCFIYSYLDSFDVFCVDSYVLQTLNDDVERLCSCGLSLPEPRPQRLEGSVAITVVVLLNTTRLKKFLYFKY